MSGMSDSKVDNEPSIEEILSSIRQIINEDDEDTSTDVAASGKDKPKSTEETAPEASDSKEDDVLDLAAFAEDEASEDDKPAEPTPSESETEMSEDKADETIAADDLDAMFDAPAEETKDEAPADDFAFEEAEIKSDPQSQQPSMNASVEDSIMSSDTVNAAAASLTKLAEANVKIDHSHAKGDGSITLEDVVKQMLKPMMKEWLDSNLPPLVERLVEKEIRKISNR